MFNSEETQVGLANFLEWKMGSEMQLEQWTEGIASAPPVDPDQLLEKCRNLSSEIHTETDNLALEVAAKNENALAHLMCHWSAIDPDCLTKISGIGPVEPKALTENEVAEHQKMFDITKDFLVKVGRM
jgi:predicted flap endonuclease-1-like 5' DNA nuclease